MTTLNTKPRSRRTQLIVILAMRYMGFEPSQFNEFQSAISENYRDLQDTIWDELDHNVKNSTWSNIIGDERYKPSQILWVKVDKAVTTAKGDLKAAFASLTGGE